MLFSKYFGLSSDINNYEFFDINIEGDTRRFVDPFAVSQLNGQHGLQMQTVLKGFMTDLLGLIRKGDMKSAIALCSHLTEPKGTRLGYSIRRRDGHGAGDYLSSIFLDSLFKLKDAALENLAYLEECKLLCDGIDRDIISDITVNVCMLPLIEFTQAQCRKYDIPMQRTKKRLYYFCKNTGAWKEDYFELPHVDVVSHGVVDYIILVPLRIVPEKSPYDPKTFYTQIAAEYFEKDALDKNAPCIKEGKNGRRVLRGEMKLLEEYQPTKANLRKLIDIHPSTLTTFRNNVAFPRLIETLGRLI